MLASIFVDRRYRRPTQIRGLPSKVDTSTSDGYLNVVRCTTPIMMKVEASMNKKLIHIGLDVDDTQYHGAALDKETGELVSFKC